MLLPILIQSSWYRVSFKKSVAVAFILTVCGTIGTYLWFFIENHWIGGTSFYGAVFVVPILFVLVSKLFQIPYGDIMDLCAPAECAMLAVMKVQCLISGCCGGKEIYFSGLDVTIRFPSQIAELINALLICGILMALAAKQKRRGELYILYMLIYGGTRLILNQFREAQSAFLFGLAPGTVWSLLSIIVGVVCLITKKKLNEQKCRID